MPTRPSTRMERDLCEELAAVAAAIDSDGGSTDTDDLLDNLILAAAEPFQRRLKQEIGEEFLSLARLQRECAGFGTDGDDMSWNVYDDYGFRLHDLPLVVRALDPPDKFSTHNGAFTGEEGVLLLLRRYRKPATLLGLTKETGRSKEQLSEAIGFMVEHIHARFPHLPGRRAVVHRMGTPSRVSTKSHS